ELRILFSTLPLGHRQPEMKSFRQNHSSVFGPFQTHREKTTRDKTLLPPSDASEKNRPVALHSRCAHASGKAAFAYFGSASSSPPVTARLHLFAERGGSVQKTDSPSWLRWLRPEYHCARQNISSSNGEPNQLPALAAAG